jgi:putative oxidoreductase
MKSRKETVRRSLPMILIRVIVAVVFLTEGILKLVYPAEYGSGRFAHIALIYPQVLGPLVGLVEIAAGAAVLANFFAGDAAIFLLAVILAALVTTKIPILLGHPLGPFALPKNVNHTGILGFLHESRTELAMLFSLVAIAVDSGVRGGRQTRWYQR